MTPGRTKHNRRETFHYASSALAGDPSYWQDKGVVRALVWAVIGDGLYGQLQRLKPGEDGAPTSTGPGSIEENRKE